MAEMTLEQQRALALARAREREAGSSGGFNPMTSLHDSATGVGQGITLGFGDEIMAGMATPFRAGYNYLTGGDPSISGAYNTELGRQRDILHGAEKRSPIGTGVGELAGGLALGGNAAAGAAPVKATYPALIKQGAKQGAAYGGLYGFGSGEGTEDRLGKAATGAAVGGATGAVLGGASAYLANRGATKSMPNVADLETAKTNAYKAVDNSGVTYDFDTFGKKFSADVRTAAINAKRHPKAFSLLEDVENNIGKGYQPTLTEMDQFRQVVRRDLLKSTDASEQFFGEKMLDSIDDFINSGPKGAADAINTARKANTMWRKSETIQDALETAELRTTKSGSGGNIDNNIRNEVFKILKNKKQVAPFTQTERKAMKDLVEGTNLQNWARWIGKLSPEGNGLALLLHAVAGVKSGGSSLPLAGVGFLAKRYADQATPTNLANLSHLIAGTKAPQPMLSGPGQGVLGNLIRGGAVGVNYTDPMFRR